MAIKCTHCGASKANLRRVIHFSGHERLKIISCMICGELWMEGVVKGFGLKKTGKEQPVACTACGDVSVIATMTKTGLCGECSARLSTYKRGKKRGFDAFNPFKRINRKWIFIEGINKENMHGKH